MTEQVLSSSGVADNPDNHLPIDHHKLLVARRASLIQQAEALKEQRRAILAEVGEIEKQIGFVVK